MKDVNEKKQNDEELSVERAGSFEGLEKKVL